MKPEIMIKHKDEKHSFFSKKLNESKLLGSIGYTQEIQSKISEQLCIEEKINNHEKLITEVKNNNL
ncbi:CLUMA_CG021190, isoform A [Clunio marinus]|uniref:CLUMA_CG021190, isoform A n=1 Tax=Clunio marinus TaxID=568069 RepID=A0A1J1J6C8_9DIPT|nr:CLUMA_CG021190, isoform A [Clunio marinus]